MVGQVCAGWSCGVEGKLGKPIIVGGNGRSNEWRQGDAKVVGVAAVSPNWEWLYMYGGQMEWGRGGTPVPS